ncbi:MAG: lysozyme inhibitor LprI family protein, partial [Psychrobacter sp.]
LGTCFVSANTSAASFDCTKASTWVETSICSDAELSDLDEKMAQQYKSELAETTTNDIRHAQQTWLKFQRNTCKSKECLLREYKEYLEGRDVSYAQDLIHGDAPSQQAFDTFYEDVDISVYNPDTQAWGEAQSTTHDIEINSVTNRPYIAVVDATLIFTNGHTCSVDTEVAYWADNHWSIVDYYEDAELRLYPVSTGSKTELLLIDVDGQYRLSHCGMRGYFDSKTFETM